MVILNLLLKHLKHKSEPKPKLAAWLRWQKGRQGTGYDKFMLVQNPFIIPFDCYLLHFPIGVSIPPHKDQVKSGRHFRLNIIIKKSKSGGEFLAEKSILNLGRIKLFRPDLYTHEVTQVQGSTRWVLSVGWVLQ